MRRFLVLIKNILSMPKRLFSHVSLFCAVQDAKIDKKSAICKGVRFYRSSIGKYSYIGNNSFVADTEIGNFTSISTDCYIGGATHPLDWVSTSSVFHKWENIMKKNFARNEFEIFAKTTIGNDVWIGNRVMIKAGLTIADGAVVGMGSVVTKDIGPYEIWAGNPARFIRKRFDDETAENLRKTEWWNKSDEEIEKIAVNITEPKKFIEEMK